MFLMRKLAQSNIKLNDGIENVVSKITDEVSQGLVENTIALGVT
jgi:hypothetical protein